MARYEDVSSAEALSEAQIMDRLVGNEPEAAASTAQPAHLVARWMADPQTGRPVCHWTLGER